MGTHACWILWIGFSIDPLNSPLSKKARDFIDNIGWDFMGKEIEHIRFENIYMHGQLVGLGTVIRRLRWDTNINTDNVFDMRFLETVNPLLAKVESIFLRHELPKPQIYHHIDLGG